MKLKVQKIPWFLSWKGLLFQKSEPILLHTRWGIHTFFMKEPIDAIILDEKHTVKKIKKGLLPYHFFFWNPLYKNVIELPENSIEKEKIHLGQKIELQTF